MTDFVITSLNTGLRAGVEHSDYVVNAPVPSLAMLAAIKIDKMLKDADVQALDSRVQRATEDFVREVIQSFSFADGTSIAVFGDAEEDVGEITLLDRLGRREMQVTVRSDGRADIWMRSTYAKHEFRALEISQIPLLSAIFSGMK